MARASKYDESKHTMLLRISAAQSTDSVMPSIREFADELDVGVATAHSYLSKLASEGLIEWEPGRHRSLRLTRQGSQLLSRPAARSA